MEDFDIQVRSRIEQIMWEYKLTPSKFASILKVDRVTVGNLLRGDNVGSKVYKGIVIGFPEVNMNWLFRGVGQMKITEPDLKSEKEKIKFYNKINDLSEVMATLEKYDERISRIEDRLNIS